MISIVKKIVFVITFLLSTIVSGQSINNYEHVVVPEQFEFQRYPHDYDVNKMIQFTFNKFNFKAVIGERSLPDGIDFCEVLFASISKKGFLNTRLTLVLKDCKGGIVFTSQEGGSIKKDYKVAYYEAIRNIFKDPRLKSHKYSPVKKSKTFNNTKEEFPKTLKGKGVVKNPAKITGPSIIFKLREKQYTFQPIGKNYVIKDGDKTIGEARLNPDNVSYTLKADALSGTGVFDDYGNFELTRINPLTQKQIKDVLARTN